MNGLDIICSTNKTTPEEAREAAKPYYYRPKTEQKPWEVIDAAPTTPIDAE